MDHSVLLLDIRAVSRLGRWECKYWTSLWPGKYAGPGPLVATEDRRVCSGDPAKRPCCGRGAGGWSPLLRGLLPPPCRSAVHLPDSHHPRRCDMLSHSGLTLQVLRTQVDHLSMSFLAICMILWCDCWCLYTFLKIGLSFLVWICRRSWMLVAGLLSDICIIDVFSQCVPCLLISGSFKFW